MTAPDFGPRPKYADLPVADLAVDSSYQRSIEARRNQAAIERICENFRWRLFGIVTVTKGLTGYLIIGGQHRTEAARRLKIQSVPCHIVPPLSRQDQALAFVAANRDRVSVTVFAIHHALAAAGDAKAVALAAMCAAADIEVPRYPIPASTMKPGQTLAIAALATFLESAGHARAVELLGAVRRAFRDDRGAIRAPLILAVDQLDAAESIDAPALERALTKIGAKAFEKECATLLLEAASRNRTQAAATVIARLIGRSAVAVPTITPSVKSLAKPAAPPPVAKAQPKPHKPIPVSDGRAAKKTGPTREELDNAISSFVAKKGVTHCPPAAVAPTQADPGSKFEHLAVDEHVRQSQVSLKKAEQRRAQITALKRRNGLGA